MCYTWVLKCLLLFLQYETSLRPLTVLPPTATDLQMLDRLSAGFVTLSPATYDLVLVLSDTNGARRTEFQDGCLRATEAREAILAGLVEKNSVFVKLVDKEAISEPNGSDEVIDEDGLLSEDDLKIPLQQPRVQKEATTSL
ncbi:hypothetical protein Egran_01684 [Elaphomyces granulatus]|uniref:Fe-S cluster assembly protein Dre2 N-terminal domain-containing protein n=1 Tax=Elaphomyces granulatus TaxID=519963 RepID=A0A232M2B5_9EURO|nr:hypothetical protein Egran_01684 [Elaphomyces granulatus]